MVAFARSIKAIMLAASLLMAPFSVQGDPRSEGSTAEDLMVKPLPLPSEDNFLKAFHLKKTDEGSYVRNSDSGYEVKKYLLTSLFNFGPKLAAGAHKLAPCGKRSYEIMVGYVGPEDSGLRAGILWKCDGTCVGTMDQVSALPIRADGYKRLLGSSPNVGIDPQICQTVWKDDYPKTLKEDSRIVE